MKVIFLLLIVFALARGAYGEDLCVHESIGFAQCVDQTIMKDGRIAKNREELRQMIYKNCQDEVQKYRSCGQIDKTAFADQFVKSHVDLYKKEKPAALVDAHNPEDAPQFQ